MTQLSPKEPNQFRIDYVGHFFVGVVTDIRNQNDLAIGKDACSVSGFFRVGRIVLLAAEDQSWSVDVLPVIDDGIHVPHMVG